VEVGDVTVCSILHVETPAGASVLAEPNCQPAFAGPG
jgi:hypothetical protein